jgi:hypothetical protein
VLARPHERHEFDELAMQWSFGGTIAPLFRHFRQIEPVILAHCVASSDWDDQTVGASGRRSNQGTHLVISDTP